jgi:hypothetical protein
MKLRLPLGIIGCTLLTILAPSIQPVQARDYGTSRQLRSCPSRTEPTRGRISVEQAKMYVACYYEDQPITGPDVKFVDILSLEIAAKPRAARPIDLRLVDIDIEKPIYELRGSLVVHTCENLVSQYNAPRGQNCSIGRELKAIGKCYQTPFGEWHCVMGGMGLVTNQEYKMPAPE